ncbi:hypothetical protein FOM92_10065 [Sphingorhabdus contaminans]|uniref:Uncharacterized protein n=1 Tax=Sphingorhabdus contaminans TaxID=1343899 RepID=A0A553WA06_9SPHN|nr:hypothetical protein FOM92_10065 [Sphingorhabdus contaminans]
MQGRAWIGTNREVLRQLRPLLPQLRLPLLRLPRQPPRPLLRPLQLLLLLLPLRLLHPLRRLQLLSLRVFPRRSHLWRDSVRPWLHGFVCRRIP